jgi:hypothetical protein
MKRGEPAAVFVNQAGRICRSAGETKSCGRRACGHRRRFRRTVANLHPEYSQLLASTAADKPIPASDRFEYGPVVDDERVAGMEARLFSVFL